MINFIIYEDEKKYRQKYISIILKIIGSSKYAYKIIEIDKYDKNVLEKINKIVGKKIFICDIDVPNMSGLDLVKEIRRSGDWNSQIIIVSEHEHLRNIALNSRLLLYDFISKYYNCEENIKECILSLLNILNSHKSLNFQYNGEIFQIPYDDILCIERNIEDHFSTIVTKNKKIPLNKMLGNIEEELKNDPRFIRTHRSCIVNIYNVTNIKLKENVINFKNYSTSLLSRDKKNEIKEKLDLGSKREIFN